MYLTHFKTLHTHTQEINKTSYSPKQWKTTSEIKKNILSKQNQITLPLIFGMQNFAISIKPYI